MLLRKAGYTGGAYREQYEKKMKDTYPVIEFILYWGKARQLVRDVENTIEFFHVTLEKACEGLGITVDRYHEAKSI